MSGRPCILVIDDDEDIRTVLAEILELRGYDVITAEGGHRALDLLDSGIRPCAILLDLMMPGMSGWEFREAQRRRPGARDIPVVVLSGDRRGRELAATLGAADVVAKPVELTMLADLLDRHCA